MARAPVSTASFCPTGFFALRTALLPFRVLVDWAEGMAAPSAVSSGGLEDAISEDRKELSRRLKAMAEQPVTREALFVASPSTSVDLDKWLAGSQGHYRRLEGTVARYVQRMAGRATPFGLFAGCSVGRVADCTRLLVGPAAHYRRYTRVDNEHLSAVMEHLERNPTLRAALRYCPNSSLYRLAGRWRYVQTSLRGGRRDHNLVALDADEYLDATVACAQNGASIADLVEHVLTSDSDGDITESEAAAYIAELIDRQVLVSSLSPIVTGVEAIDDLIEQLRTVSSFDHVTDTLLDARLRLGAVDSRALGIDVGQYREVGEVLGTVGVPVAPSRLLQVDMIKPAPSAAIGATVVDELVRAVSLLYRLSSWSGNESLRRFKEAFQGRYERREVPLCEVLDEESGIGFDRSQAPTAENAPLLNGIVFPGATGGLIGSWTARDVYLLAKVQGCQRDGVTAFELSEADIGKLLPAAQAPALPLPDVLTVMAVLDAPAGPIADDFRVLIKNIMGPSGANLLGRFCHADPELRDWVVRHLRMEEAFRPDAVFAEVVHLPEGRTGNILARPILRDYEIPYLGRSGVPAERQIPVGDLYVSVEEDRIVLRSARLGREVIPRMANAHNYSRGQGVYHFLCSLQAQSVTPWLGWLWGALDSLAFLPRVVYGRLVLARARWRVARETMASLTAGTVAERSSSLQRWRLSENLPRFVALMDHDNELPIDLDNVLSVDAFLQVVRKRDSFLLVEMFPSPDRLCAHGPEGAYVHEILVPLVRQTDVARSSHRPRFGRPRARHMFAPGSDWLYLKWYTGTTTVDSLLSEIVADLVARQAGNGAIDRWFFIRYSDPDWHVRLRLQGPSDRLCSETFVDARRLTAAALEDGRIWKVQIDTYERETERYGGDKGITWSEEIFWRDSEAVLDLLRLLPGDQGIVARWQLCLRSWDLLLTDLGLSLEAKRSLIGQARAACVRQFRTNKTTDRSLGDQFRRERKAIEALFDEQQEMGHPLAAALERLRRRSAAWEPAMHALRVSAAASGLTVSLSKLAENYLHMHANRLLRSSHRPQEFVLYDFMDRLYESQQARARGRGHPKATS